MDEYGNAFSDRSVAATFQLSALGPGSAASSASPVLGAFVPASSAFEVSWAATAAGSYQLQALASGVAGWPLGGTPLQVRCSSALCRCQACRLGTHVAVSQVEVAAAALYPPLCDIQPHQQLYSVAAGDLLTLVLQGRDIHGVRHAQLAAPHPTRSCC